MNQIKRIRTALDMSQAALGEALGVTQSNVSLYECGQTVPPDVATRLVEAAKRHGLVISFDHIYGDKAMPKRRKTAKA